MDSTASVDATEMDDLGGRLANLIEEARLRVAASLVASGRPLTMPERQFTVNADPDGNGWTTGEITIDTNIFRHQPASFPDELSTWRENAEALAKDLTAAFGDTMPGRRVFSSNGFALLGITREIFDLDGGEKWILGSAILAPTYWYLSRLREPSEADFEFALSLATEVIGILRTRFFPVYTRLPLDGLRTDRQVLEAEKVRLRALSPAERGQFISSGFVPSHMLEVDSLADDPGTVGLTPPPTVITALQLHGVDFTSSGALSVRAGPDWLTFAHYTRPVATRRFPFRVSFVNEGTFQDALRTANLLRGYDLEVPRNPAEVALHRFGLGCGRNDAADGLLDFVIALEALFLPYDPQTRNADLSYRFRMHGAHFIADAPQDRRGVYKYLTKLYDMRSRVVHGDKYPQVSDMYEAIKSVQALSAKALLKAVRKGFPDVEYFNRVMLGGDAAETDLAGP